ncbi:MAG: glycosyltransferase [Verrucomicrobiota bacterium]
MATPPKIIYSFPGIARGNDYQRRFYSLVGDRYEVRTWSLASLFRPKAILHIHWPEAWIWGSNLYRLQCLFFFFLVRFLRPLNRWKVAYTCHNLGPHEQKGGRLGKLVYDFIIGLPQAVFYLTEEGRKIAEEHRPKFRKLPGFILRHPLYETTSDATNKAQALHAIGLDPSKIQITLLGHIRPYKGVEALVEACRDLDPAKYSVNIVGTLRPKHRYLLDGIDASSGLFRVVECRLSDADFEHHLRASDVVALPYKTGLNSGVMYHALSFGTRVVAFDSPVNREIQHHFGERLVVLTDPEELSTTMGNLSPVAPDTPPLSAPLEYRDDSLRTAALEAFATLS